MTKAAEIREKNTLIHEVNGTSYKCLKLSGYVAIKCLGIEAVAGLVEAGGVDQATLEEAARKNGADKNFLIAAAVLREVMLDPELGDRQDDENNVTTLRMMGDDVQGLFNKIYAAANLGQVQDFTDSSPDPEGSK